MYYLQCSLFENYKTHKETRKYGSYTKKKKQSIEIINPDVRLTGQRLQIRYYKDIKKTKENHV